jgi:hypothetical protein
MSDGARRLVEGELVLDVRVEPGEVRVAWSGKSADREPGRFLVPALSALLAEARGQGARLVLDFGALDYMNSSTFTPVVKILDEARRGRVPITLEYSQGKKWQALSFSALRTFETPDGTVVVVGR